MNSQKTIILLTTLLILFFYSCNTKNQHDDSKGLSEEEVQFVSRFKNKLLIKTTNRSLNIKEVEVKGEDDILEIEGPNVIPVVYDKLLRTKYMKLNHQKQLFIAQILPQILIAKFFLSQEIEMLELILSDKEIDKLNFKDKKAFIEKQLLKHEAENTSDLLSKLRAHPTSIILAQAAIESNWGTTLSYAQANNPFHIISTLKSEPRFKTFGQDEEIIYLKKYNFLPAAILDYFKNINRQDRFEKFRKKRLISDNPLELVKYLENYSIQQDEKYVELLTNVITRNDLIKYDQFKIDPEFVNELSEKEIARIIDTQTEREKRIISSDSDRIEKITEKSIDIKFIELDTTEDIEAIEDKYVVPTVYTNVVSLKHLPVKEKKQKFFDLLLPSVLVASYGLNQTKEKLKAIAERIKQGEVIPKSDSIFLKTQLKSWKAKDIDELINVKLVTRPTSIMLAQAALETGWGSSRFFVHANNTFGVWSFNPDESRIKALETRSGEPVYVKKYDNLSESIIDYYKVIARGPYSEYRDSRIESDDPFEMVNHLFRYSEIGQEYIERLKTVMRKSNLVKYDKYQIDPKYINQ